MYLVNVDISVLEFMPLEAISFYLKAESFQFHKVSSPFTSYLGPDSLHIITEWLYGLAWRE